MTGKHRALIGLLIFQFSAAWAHKNHDHSAERAGEAPVNAEILGEIREKYQEKAEAIFRVSCFDCHSNETRYPWYANFPLVNKLIEDDINEAKKHLNFSGGFPFQGHGSPKEDLEAIRDSIRDGSMPPFRYRLMHWNASLTEAEKEAIFHWIEESLKLLKQ